MVEGEMNEREKTVQIKWEKLYKIVEWIENGKISMRRKKHKHILQVGEKIKEE